VIGHDQPLFEFVTTAMSTTVSVQIVGAHPNAETLAAEALDWFRVVESTCSRFDPTSELSQLCNSAPAWTTVPTLLFEVLRVALAVSQASRGAFDPTVGAALQTRGFDTHWQTGARRTTRTHAQQADWRDVSLDDATGRVRLHRALQLDLGAVAKGFALDLAARAMAGVADCCLVAGGDLLCRGTNARGRVWQTAIVHPLATDRSAGTLEVHAPEYAICTSGGYARRNAHGHHLLDPRRPGAPNADSLASATVIAPQAGIADALATAAFVLGAEDARALLEEQGGDAVLIDARGVLHLVNGWARSTFMPASF
jgi:thiamine biosynthesis lipoprotein